MSIQATVQTVSQKVQTTAVQAGNVFNSLKDTFHKIVGDVKSGATSVQHAADPNYQTAKSALFYVGILVLVLVAVED